MGHKPRPQQPPPLSPRTPSWTGEMERRVDTIVESIDELSTLWSSQLGQLIEMHNILDRQVEALRYQVQYVLQKITVREDTSRGLITQAPIVMTLLEFWSRDGARFVDECHAMEERIATSLTDAARDAQAAAPTAGGDDAPVPFARGPRGNQ